MQQTYTPLPQKFYHRPTLELAQSLLGSLLVKESNDGTTAGTIVETEAYLGVTDRAAHSFGGRRTNRTAIMFKEPGHIYTYSMHTHCLVNVVSGETENPEAILIRALEPHDGTDIMTKRRPVSNLTYLTNGPGKLSQAMGITMEDYGNKFTNMPLCIAKGMVPQDISTGKRIGIGGAGEAKDYPYRFWLTGNPYVSK